MCHAGLGTVQGQPRLLGCLLWITTWKSRDMGDQFSIAQGLVDTAGAPQATPLTVCVHPDRAGRACIVVPRHVCYVVLVMLYMLGSLLSCRLLRHRGG